MLLQRFSDEGFHLQTRFAIDKRLDINRQNPLPDELTIAEAIQISYNDIYAAANLATFGDAFIRNDIRKLTIQRKSVVPYSLDRFLQAVQFAVLYEGNLNSKRIDVLIKK